MTGVPSIPGIERSLFAYTTNDISGLNYALAFSVSIFGAVAGDWKIICHFVNNMCCVFCDRKEKKNLLVNYFVIVEIYLVYFN
jgi:hypothetical protein